MHFRSVVGITPYNLFYSNLCPSGTTSKTSGRRDGNRRINSETNVDEPSDPAQPPNLSERERSEAATRGLAKAALRDVDDPSDPGFGRGMNAGEA